MNSPSDAVPIEIDRLNQLIFQPCARTLTSVKAERESQEYLAYRLTLDEQQIAFRKSKITPTKAGQFVTLWKRNTAGTTCPFHVDEQIDYVIIVTQAASHFGAFIFPKDILYQKGIFSSGTNEGKRGFRIYPSWDQANNKQAQATQAWQLKYFVDLTDGPLSTAAGHKDGSAAVFTLMRR